MYQGQTTTFENLADFVSAFNDERLVSEIRNFEHLIDDDVVAETCLIDLIIGLYDFMRDECVERLGNSCGSNE